MCESCEQKNDVIVALQHMIRELRHDLEIARIEAKLSKGTDLFAHQKVASPNPSCSWPGGGSLRGAGGRGRRAPTGFRGPVRRGNGGD
jgi:hypothetical protein